MKKFASLTATLLGVVAIVLTMYFVINFGATNMRRVNEQSARWQMSWSSRR